MLYRIIQGEPFNIRVYSQNSILMMRDSSNILTFNKVIEDDNGDLWLQILIDQQNFISAGVKQYQLFQNNHLKDSGNIVIIASLLVDSGQSLLSKSQLIVQSIEAMLAGTASRAQRTVKVGDKEIQYMSTSQLLSLLDYFKGKVKEEEGIEEAGINEATDEMKIKYVWRIR